ncbi:MAG: nuclease, partial [Ramlibacter sp.]|nr:nuclease [Ramlibacter sp.]
ADLTTRRPVPSTTLDTLNPFLFLNHHGPQTYRPHNHGLPFGPHPHRGFETVTFILEGSLAHADTGGHESVIEAGGVQWMTAGSGLIHTEVAPQAFKDAGGKLEILQLWVNLPASLKMTPPRYTGLQRDEIPLYPAADGMASIQLISGALAGKVGPIESLTGLFMSVVRAKESAKVSFANLEGRVVFLYVVRGAVAVNGTTIPEFNLARLNDDGDAVSFEALTDSIVLFGHGDPIHEPMAARGPFVMNTDAEIVQAIADFRAGKMGVSAGGGPLAPLR